MMRATTAPRVTSPEGRRRAILADLVAVHLRGTGDGHCIRINYLTREEAEDVCWELRDRTSTSSQDLHIYILLGAGHGADSDVGLTTDRAIELRNRKHGTLCLFVPPDLVDATVSSLGNSFAEIDGRTLHRNALTRVQHELGPVAQDMVRHVLGAQRGRVAASTDEQLDFALSAATRERAGELEKLGLELWRVGLIADGRADFDSYIAANRRHTGHLSRPQRLGASYRDRITSLKVSPKTARELEAFFATRPMHDVSRWSRELAEGIGPTFDTWVFPEAVRTNLTSVQLEPFTDTHGAVTRSSRLLQPDGADGALIATYGEKEFINVKWTPTPLKPLNVQSWHVEIVVSGEGDGLDDDSGLDLPSREVKGTGRTARVKLNIDVDSPPEDRFRVRVVAVDETGNEISDAENKLIEAFSEEFYLTSESRVRPKSVSQRRRTVASLAVGRLQAGAHQSFALALGGDQTREYQEVTVRRSGGTGDGLGSGRE